MQNGKRQYVRKKYAKKFSKDKKCETWDLMKKWRNEATRLRRKAIKTSLELNDNPRKFFSTFSPFISSKGQRETNEIHLNIKNKIEQGQRIVSEEFVDYFSTVFCRVYRLALQFSGDWEVKEQGLEHFFAEGPNLVWYQET